MNDKDFATLLKVIGKLNNSLEEKPYTKHEVKQLLLKVAKEIENENNGFYERV